LIGNYLNNSYLDNMTSASVVRWIARIVGIVVLAFLLFFVLADLLNKDSGDSPLPLQDKVAFIFFPLSTIVGLGLAWRWEGLGGLITIAGLIGLLTIRPDLFSSPLLMAIIAIPGLLFLLYWFLSRREATG